MPPYSNEWFQGDCPTCGQEKHVRKFPALGILCVDCYFAKGSLMRRAKYRARENRVARLSYGTVRRLGSVSRSVCDGFLGVGRFIKGAPKLLTRSSPASVRSSPPGPPTLPRDAIRSIVIEELARMRVAEGRITPPELEERLRLMAAAIGALQERIDKIGHRGSIISEASMWKEVGSLEAAESLTHDERTLLVNVFLSVELIRPLAHGVIQGDGKTQDNKYLTAAQQLVRHLLALIKQEPGEPVSGVIGAPARASVTSQRVLIDAARGILDAVMIVSEPFAVAYGLGILDQALIVDIGAGTVDLCRLHGTLPEEKDQITLDEAGDFVDEKLEGLIREKHPEAQFNINMVRALKERYGFVSQNADRVTARFPVKGRPTEFDITDELRAACKGIVPGIVDSIAELIATFDPEFQEVLCAHVIVAGGGSQMIGLPTLIEQGMEELGGGRVTRVQEPLYAGSNGALKMAQRMPKHFWKMLA